MTLEEFEDLIDGHGPDSVSWPAQHRADALALLMASPQARLVLDEARNLSAAFASAPVVRAPAGLAARITLAAASSDDGVASASIASMTAAHQRRATSGTRSGRAASAKRLRLFRRVPGISALTAVGSGIALPLCFVVGLAAALLTAQSSAGDYWTDAPAAFALAN